LRAPADGRFHEDYARVRAQVTYVRTEILKLSSFWRKLYQCSERFTTLWAILQEEPTLAPEDLYQALLIAPAVVDHKITALHAHFGSIATTVARLVSRMTGIPYLFTAHAKDIFHEEVDPTDLRHKLQDAARVITVSDYNVAYLRDCYGDAAQRVTRIYNGLDLTKFPYRDPVARPPRIVGVGRLVEKKGFDILIDACAILAQRGCAFECAIIGDGLLADALQQRVIEHGLTEQVKLLGPRAQGAVIEHVQSAALFAAPCVVGQDGNRDGLPTVLLEAMALGTPCISTDVTGIPELLVHDVTGLMVPQHDPLALAAAMEELLATPLRRRTLAQNARRLIETNFDITQNTALIRALYPAVAHRAPATAAAPTTAPSSLLWEVA
jgi:glycosyltransferase involved in cell wall biosynthesis